MYKFSHVKLSDLFTSFISYLKVEKKYSHHTCISYENDISGFLNYCENDFEIFEVANIQSTHIRSWIVSLMTQGISNVSVNRKISALRSFYKWMLRKSYVSINPMLKILAPKKPKRLPVTVQDANIGRLLEPNLISDESDNPFVEIRDTFIITLLYSTGIRRGELVNLKVDDFNLFRKEMRVVGKGNKVRSIPLTEEMIDTYNTYLTGRTEAGFGSNPTLLLTAKGMPIYPRLVHQIVSRKLAPVTSLTKKSPHVLRHSFATHMLDRGADLNAIKEILGHVNLAATQVYTHNSITKLKEAYRKAHPKSENKTH